MSGPWRGSMYHQRSRSTPSQIQNDPVKIPGDAFAVFITWYSTCQHKWLIYVRQTSQRIYERIKWQWLSVSLTISALINISHMLAGGASRGASNRRPPGAGSMLGRRRRRRPALKQHRVVVQVDQDGPGCRRAGQGLELHVLPSGVCLTHSHKKHIYHGDLPVISHGILVIFWRNICNLMQTYC